MLPDVYRKNVADNSCDWADATTFHYFWAGAEDAVLDAMCGHVMQHEPKHLSLHFDGIRVDKAVVVSIEQLRTDIEQAVKEKTGFTVSVVEKKHKLLIELLESDGAHLDTPHDLVITGNCIPLAMYRILPSEFRRPIIDRVGESPLVGGALHRSYSDFLPESLSPQCGLYLEPSVGYTINGPGEYLLHSEMDGCPHCIAVTVVECDGSLQCSVYDG